MKTVQKYNSLEDIRLQKEMLQTDLHQNEQQIALLWSCSNLQKLFKRMLQPLNALSAFLT